jgi:hypothetical protein
MSIKIYFGNIEGGNFPIELESENQILLFTTSYIPYDSFSELVDSLIAVMT